MKSKAKEILKYVENLPYFYVANLKMLDISDRYINIIVNRFFKKGLLIRLKRQCYVSKRYIETVKTEGEYSGYIEYVSSKIYEPSYLSLEYVLYENNVLTESPQKFTLVTKNKTAEIRNALGSFLYHKIKDEFFDDYIVKKKGAFLAAKASPGKALFDFLYLRKNIIMNKNNAKALRLNLANLAQKDARVFMKYAKMAGSRMEKLAEWILC